MWCAAAVIVRRVCVLRQTDRCAGRAMPRDKQSAKLILYACFVGWRACARARAPPCVRRDVVVCLVGAFFLLAVGGGVFSWPRCLYAFRINTLFRCWIFFFFFSITLCVLCDRLHAHWQPFRPPSSPPAVESLCLVVSVSVFDGISYRCALQQPKGISFVNRAIDHTINCRGVGRVRWYNQRIERNYQEGREESGSGKAASSRGKAEGAGAEGG